MLKNKTLIFLLFTIMNPKLRKSSFYYFILYTIIFNYFQNSFLFNAIKLEFLSNTNILLSFRPSQILYFQDTPSALPDVEV